MVTLSACNLQQVELRISQLKQYLNLYELQASCGTAHTKADASSRGRKRVVPGAQQDADLGGARNAPAQNTQDAQRAQDVPAAPAGPAAQGAHNMRRRCANVTKIAVLMFILKLKFAWFGFYFVGAVLYIGGIFDPIVDWFLHRPLQTTLEEKLNVLRNRQRSAEQALAGATDSVSDQISTPEGEGNSETSTGPPVENSLDVLEGAAGLGLNDVEDRDGPNRSTSIYDANNEINTALDSSVGREVDANTGNDAGDDTGNEDPPPPWLHRFVYQLIVMFFMTLLPWWTPDLRYISA